MNRKRARHILTQLRGGPTEAGYAFLRARRRRRNIADDEPDLLPSDRVAGADFAVDADDLEANAALVARQGGIEIRTVEWLVPGFYLVWGGGVQTVLRFADQIARNHGVENRFTVFDSDDPRVVERVRHAIATAFPALAGARVAPAAAPPQPCDAAIGTAWEGGWRLVRMRTARAKFMFVQDWEPDFYPAGSKSAMLAELARQGIPAIANGEPLAASWRACGSPAVAFTPAVDRDRFRPPATARRRRPVRIVFYGRPRTARNAFGLGLEALRLVKRRHGDAVDIVCAGEDWTPGQYGAADVLRNAGMLESLDAVAELYRSAHIGLVFMLTRHPSYQPLEFMASGVAVVTNRNAWTGWLLEHERTALISAPLPSLVADQIDRLVVDDGLRERLAAAGRERVAAASWEDEFERVWAAVRSGGFGPPG